MKVTATILNDFFDHIYVINLERDKERKIHIERIFGDLDFTFWEAADMRKLDIEGLMRKGIVGDASLLKNSRKPRALRLAQIACALSHRQIYEDMLEKGYEQVLIFEDDISQMPENTNLEDAIAELPANWGVFMLGHRITRYMNPKRKFDEIMYTIFHKLGLFRWDRISMYHIKNQCTVSYSDNLLKVGVVYGAHAYGVSRIGAEKLLKHQTPVLYPADVLFNHANLQMVDLDIYGLSESIFSGESEEDGKFDSHTR